MNDTKKKSLSIFDKEITDMEGVHVNIKKDQFDIAVKRMANFNFKFPESELNSTNSGIFLKLENSFIGVNNKGDFIFSGMTNYTRFSNKLLKEIGRMIQHHIFE